MAVTSTTKVCTKCKIEKSLDEFHKNSQQKSGYNPSCKNCKNKKNNEQWNSLPFKIRHEKARERQLKYRYGITLEQYYALLKEQNFVCAICKRAHKAWRGSYLTVDHCHNTGEIRGLLCGSCNAALGKFDDNPELLINAYIYLQKKEGDYFGSYE